ncbi:serine protease [Burkholderia contaminans]|uniref:Serine protease n=1 Tax=Burkholderia contaminans TaxID=488447 RepID=A0A3N8QWG6_9BURK|nr:serine protease [Burkholderia contaminans]RQT10393.1 serine protease [Burkholderia contaminans]
MSWHASNKKIRPYVVRIETPNNVGTGFLFAYNDTKTVAAIATASHVVDEAHDWKLPIKVTHHESGEQIFLRDEERVIFVDREHDSASILIEGGSLPFPKETLPLIEKDKYAKVGVELGWVGFPSVAHPELCFFAGHVSAFISNQDCYLIDGVAINGVSGGPVFNDRADDPPRIVGIISAYLPNQTEDKTLPGLLRAQDISPFYNTLKTLGSLGEAREKEQLESATASQVQAAQTSD